MTIIEENREDYQLEFYTKHSMLIAVNPTKRDIEEAVDVGILNLSEDAWLAWINNRVLPNTERSDIGSFLGKVSGRELIERVISTCRNENVKRIVGKLSPTFGGEWEEVEAFYRRHGFDVFYKNGQWYISKVLDY